jgi:hypothetical protein
MRPADHATLERLEAMAQATERGHRVGPVRAGGPQESRR